MKGFDFPIFKTRIENTSEKFALEDPVERRKYFEFKAGPEIEKLRDWLRKNTFLGILIGKKNSGKGTYSKLFMEAVGADHVAHVSVGDIVRDAHKEVSNESKKEEFISYIKKRYRGPISVGEALDALLGRNTKVLLPTEFILTLVERKISSLGRKSVFVDGFPRDMDQISYSLYFRSLMGYRDDPDFFVFIDLPESVIDERMRFRVICPKCQTPRNTKLLRTKEIGYDRNKKEFYLICDNPQCSSLRMISKEGDELGIEAMRERIEIDEKVAASLLNFTGIPKIFLRNSIPVAKAREFVDDYEITPAYRYELQDGGEIKVIEEPWVIKDDQGVPSHSLLPQPIAVSLIKQIAEVLGL